MSNGDNIPGFLYTLESPDFLSLPELMCLEYNT
jgi:hypothetical protein